MCNAAFATRRAEIHRYATMLGIGYMVAATELMS